MKLLKVKFLNMCLSPTPHGVGGLKLEYDELVKSIYGPTPHGVGGLKWR